MIQNGRIVLADTAERLLGNAQMRTAYLGEWTGHSQRKEIGYMKSRWVMAVVAASLMTAGPAAAQSLRAPSRSPWSAPSPGAGPRPASESRAR